MSALTALVNHAASNGGCVAVVGIMSGTSMDGVDLALVEMHGSASSQGSGKASGWGFRVVAFETVPFPADVSEDEFAALAPTMSALMANAHSAPMEALCRVNHDWSHFVGREVLCFLRRVEEATTNPPYYSERRHRVVIGSHGQTLWHVHGHSTLQIGDPEVLAQVTGVTVVGNFRSADVAAGGCGAPLVPFFDGAVSRLCAEQDIAWQNFGGIGNVTLVRGHAVCAAFDTGPANVPLNEFILRVRQWAREYHLSPAEGACTGAEQDGGKGLGWEGIANGSPFDEDGVYSGGGSVDSDLLQAWRRRFDAYLTLPPPKSTGRELFGATFAQSVFDESFRGASSGAPTIQRFCDVCATLVEFSAVSTVDAYSRFLPVIPPTVVVSGGGRRNPTLLRRFQALLEAARGASVRIASLAELLPTGTVPPTVDADDAKEAIAFAALAHERLCPFLYATVGGSSPFYSNEPAATGAQGRVLLGSISSP